MGVGLDMGILVSDPAGPGPKFFSERGPGEGKSADLESPELQHFFIIFPHLVQHLELNRC